MSDQACNGGSAVLSESHDKMKYAMFTNVSCTEWNHDQQQISLYVFDSDTESVAKNEKETLGLVEVSNGSFYWPHPRGDIVTADVTLGDFTCSKEQMTQKLTSTKLQDKWIFRLPPSNATRYIGNMKILDKAKDRILVTITDVTFPMWPKKTKDGAEHDER